MEEIFIPATGMTMEDAELISWLKQPGDAVKAGDPIATVETDKATVDITAETDGVLDDHLVDGGATVSAGAVITRVLHKSSEAGTADGPSPSPADQPRSWSPPEPTPAEPTSPAVLSTEIPATADPAPAVATSEAGAEESSSTARRRPHKLSPRKRREARERAEAAARNGADEDETAASPTQLTLPKSNAPAVTPRAPVTHQPVAPVPVSASSAGVPGGTPQRTDAVARAVAESWSAIPHFAVSREIDVTGMLLYLDQIRSSGVMASVTDLLLRASATAWSAVQYGGPDLIGLSVATPRRVINVAVRGAATRPLGELAAQRAAVVDRARRGLLKPDDLATSPVTVSNLGTHNVDWFTGIVPVGQLGLFTIGRARNTVQLINGRVVNRQMMWVTANLDHRAFDGADAAELLGAFATACTITLTDPSTPREGLT